jgi:hypothetical protein
MGIHFIFTSSDRRIIALSPHGIGGALFEGGTDRLPEHYLLAAITRRQGDSEMKRLLLIGVAVCAFAALPMLSASAMPRASADQLVSDTDSTVILAHGGHGHHGHHGWGRGHHHRW